MGKSDKVDMKSIKAYEKAMRASVDTSKKEQIMDFDAWWSMRLPVLKQPSHIKEILQADARARGVGPEDTCEKWDWAAKQFGLVF